MVSIIWAASQEFISYLCRTNSYEEPWENRTRLAAEMSLKVALKNEQVKHILGCSNFFVEGVTAVCKSKTSIVS